MDTFDLEFSDHGSIVLCTPVTDAGKEWIAEHVSDDALWHGRSLVIEPRYVDDLANGAAEDGLNWSYLI